LENDISIKSEPVVIPNHLFVEHGNEIEELISRRPPFIVRRGTMLLFFIMLATILTSWLIRYPDIILASAKLTSINAPKPVITLVNGKLIKLNVHENQQVAKNEVLGFIESTGNHQQIINLSADLQAARISLNNKQPELVNKYFNDYAMQLGELQTAYQVFSQAFLYFKNYLSNGFYLRKKKMLTTDMENLHRLHSSLMEQKGLNEEDLSLSQKTFAANELLKHDSVISAFDYRNEQSKLISKKLNMPQVAVSIITNESQQNEKKKEIEELENTISQQKNIFLQALNTFISQIEDWKRKYLLIAPIEGKISFASFMQENQQLQANQTICFINPENSRYYAQIIIPQTNLGKVYVGQQVLLRFPSYPSEEYGALSGRIEFISHIPTDSGYLARVVLPEGLTTIYKHQILYRDGLTANGEIITKDMRLLERIYYSIVRKSQ